MHRSTDFASVVRSGARARRGSLVVHHATALRTDGAPLVGLIVGKAVGGSVVRHGVSRKLRAQLSQRLLVLPTGSGTVIRALSGAAGASSAELGGDLDAALATLGCR